MFYLTILKGWLVVQYDGPRGGKVTRRIKGAQEYARFFQSKATEYGVPVEDLHIMASSSVDFPEEYTDRAEVIELCNRLRG